MRCSAAPRCGCGRSPRSRDGSPGRVFGARIAYRLTPPVPARLGAVGGGAVAGVGVLGLNTYSHWVLIANSDPLNVTLLLAAIDAHLSKRPRLAFAVLVLAALGRPEVWPFAGLYAVWLWVRVPGRAAVGGGRAHPDRRRLVHRARADLQELAARRATWRSTSARSSTATRSSGVLAAMAQPVRAADADRGGAGGRCWRRCAGTRRRSAWRPAPRCGSSSRSPSPTTAGRRCRATCSSPRR